MFLTHLLSCSDWYSVLLILRYRDCRQMGLLGTVGQLGTKEVRLIATPNVGLLCKVFNYKFLCDKHTCDLLLQPKNAKCKWLFVCQVYYITETKKAERISQNNFCHDPLWVNGNFENQHKTALFLLSAVYIFFWNYCRLGWLRLHRKWTSGNFGAGLSGCFMSLSQQRQSNWRVA